MHPRTIVAFVNETLSGITQYYRTVGNIWDSLYVKHQLRESNVTLDRVYTMLAEFFIELKLHEERNKIAQIVTGSSSTVKHSMYDEYINASKGKVLAKGKGKRGDGKGCKSKWRAACEEYWKPGGCSQGHNCPKYHPRRQPGRCAICGSTRHYTSLHTSSEAESQDRHDAKSMENFTLHFDMAEQCESLDRAWFGEMGFPVEKYTYKVQSSFNQDSIPDPADLDLDEGYSEPELCFSKSQVRDPAYALLDSGAARVLLAGHMLPKGARSFEVTVNRAVGNEKARCWRNDVYAEDRAHPLLPLGRLANLLDTKVEWENGEAVMQCRDKVKWRTMTKFDIRNNMAYASQIQFEVL